ncbi:hypothetical protein Cop2CBH44_23220 [Coprobacter secundus subsp. similis]|uniref:Uncharacterized protein n=1 Tax=Coprobacter secundus subsp. similis TaxID=2751153 RepID=A0A7G1HW99_9BACT|nr:hypothetical protein Cop2CBH44_23220 [Coprobacter secundus subsp. similis]
MPEQNSAQALLFLGFISSYLCIAVTITTLFHSFCS